MIENRDQPKDDSNTKGEPNGITEIRVGGFKSIVKPQAIEIRPLTILAGANSSGKSSFIQPLLLLKQTLEATYDPGTLLLDGPNVKFTSGEQLLSRIAGKPRVRCFQVAIRVQPARQLGLVLGYVERVGFKTEKMTIKVQNVEISLSPDMTQGEMSNALSLLRVSDSKALSTSVYRDRFFLGIEASGKAEGFNESLKASPGRGTLERSLRSMIHVPGLRGQRERTYPVAAIGPTFPGTFENYFASVIAHWQTEENQERLVDLNRQLTNVGLNSYVTAQRVTEVAIELRVARLLHPGGKKRNDLVNIADVGSGVSQTLPVLVALLVASPRQTVYIEEPETHSHPKAQVQMAGVLAEAARRGVRVIAETHSSLLLRAVQTLVAKGELAPNLVKLHWFTRNEKDGATEVRSADLDENGAFGDWPADFDDVGIRTEGEYLDAVEARSKS